MLASSATAEETPTPTPTVSIEPSQTGTVVEASGDEPTATIPPTVTPTAEAAPSVEPTPTIEPTPSVPPTVTPSTSPSSVSPETSESSPLAPQSTDVQALDGQVGIMPMAIIDTECGTGTGCAGLSITNTVVNTGGGTATAADWTLKAVRNNAANDEFFFSNGQTRTVPRNATYTLSATPTAAVQQAYTTTFTCTSSKATVNTANQTVQFNSNTSQNPSNRYAYCTFTQTYQAPQAEQITVTKRVRATPLGAGTDNSSKTAQVGSDVTYTEGAIFRLYTDVNNAQGSPTNYSCTITAGGACTITVPNANVPVAAGGNQGVRFWVVEEAPVPGSQAALNTYANPILYIGNVSGPENPRPFVGRTKAMSGGGTQYLPMAATTGADKTLITADELPGGGNVAQGGSYGAVVNSRNNQVIEAKCSAAEWPNIALVLDGSSSIVQDDWTTFRNAITSGDDSVFGVLAQTEARVSVLIFGQQNIGVSGQGDWRVQAPLSVKLSANRTALTNSIPATRPASSGTNWHSALQAVANSSQKFDLVLFVTDGAPNAVLPSSGTTGTLINSPNVAVRSLEAAIYSANALKDKGSRVVAVGVGGGITSAGPNLRAVSGTMPNSDYFQTKDWGALKKQLADVAKAATCQVPIEVNKTQENADGTTTELAAEWQFAAKKEGAADVSMIGLSPQTTSTVTPSAQWDLKFTQPTNQTASVILTETPRDGWTLTGVACTLDGAPVATVLNPDAKSVTIGNLHAASGSLKCTFTNTQAQLGALAIAKAFDSSVPAGSGNITFSGTYTCTASGATAASGTWTRQGAGAATLTPAAGSIPVNQIPAGASCSATETPPSGSVGLPDNSWEWVSQYTTDGPKTIVNGQTATITVTNKAQRVHGQFQVTKAVEGMADAGLEYGGNWSCTLGTETVTGAWGPIKAGQTATVTSGTGAAQIPLGATCTVTETRPASPKPGDSSHAWDGDPVITPTAGVEAKKPGEGITLGLVTVTNKTKRVYGQFQVTKLVEGTADADLEYGGDWSCTLGTETVTGTWGPIKADATATVTTGVLTTPTGTTPAQIPAGATCTVTEDRPALPMPDDPSYGWEGDPEIGPEAGVVAKEPGEGVTLGLVTVTNTSTRVLGNFSVTKVVDGDADDTHTYAGTWECTVGTGETAPTITGTWGPIAAGAVWASTDADAIPVGALCAVTEETTRPEHPVADDHAYQWDGDPAFSDPVEAVKAGENVALGLVTVTNKTKRELGSVTWTKVDATTETLLAGSVWLLTGPDVPANTKVVDCTAAPCDTGPYVDQDPVAGQFLLSALPWGDYRLVETKAPPGYLLDNTEHAFTIGAGDLLNLQLGPIENALVTPPTLPLTGGLGRDFYTVLGLGVIGVTLGATGFARMKARRDSV